MNSEDVINKRREKQRLYEKSEKRQAYNKSEKRRARDRELRKQYRKSDKTKEQNRLYKQSCNGRFRDIKSAAKQGGKEFDITFEEYTELFYNSKCAYCGDKSTGIDRIDSAIGYILNNCSPCCWPCNSMKRTSSVDEFEARILQIFSYRNLNSKRIMDK